VSITAKDIAWCGQVDRARRERWAFKKLPKQDPPFTERDAVETAIAFSMSLHGVSQKAAADAWKAIRPAVQQLLIADQRDIWIVVSADGPRAWAVTDAGTAALSAEGQGRCWTVSTKAAVEEARARYAEVAARAPSGAGHVSSLRRSGSGVRRAR
jgi:hypothetical protein